MNILELYQAMDEGVNDPHIFKAVFMAGSPGSGKTTIANKLFTGTGLRQLNIDKFWQLYKKKGKDADYSKFWDKYKIQQNIFTKNRMGLLIDGTAKNPTKMGEVKRQLEEMGYDTAMVFVNTDLKTALHRAEERAKTPGPDEGREISPEFIEDAWTKTQKALGTYQNVFGENFFIVNNSDNARASNLDYAERKLRTWLNEEPRNHIARSWIEYEQSQKDRS